MKLVDLNVTSFIQEVDSKSPAPGGGSVSALMSSMGVALARMVGHLTVDKKKFLALDTNIQYEFKDIISSFIVIKDALIDLIDRDTEAFNVIMKAYQMPKVTEDDVRLRNEKIQEGTVQAIMVPLKVATLSLSAMHQFELILRYQNQNTLSDLGVAVLALSSGGLGACLNILINLPGLTDDIAKKQYQLQVEELIEDIQVLRDDLLKKVYDLMKTK
jgi:formiminotetrahydrofolate cyclodeaminase